MICTKHIKVFCTIFVSFLAFNSYSQFGITGGLTLSNTMVRSEAINSRTMVGGMFGISYEYNFTNNERISFTNEMIWSSRNYKIQSEAFGERIILDRYLTFPVLVNYRLKEDITASGGFEIGAPLFTTFMEDEYKDGWFAFLVQLHFFKDETVSPYIRSSISPLPRLTYRQVDQYGNLSEEIGEFRNIYFVIGCKIKFKK
ncbi:outer membrane beta-barrel protein [Mangrovivirga cuniculi]|uniref:Outer membrane protein beta-barrel domain-containing protein n=1 Tax=Mangrovivirga cuniculi TaxID=2715131 RepID=A0A4D7JL78_9BACT|nr:outer membrane beta-barrel protein [Mangrovivirga cuniculi]QCK16629.1 hypothetical protein DCC35_18780 [Mangrovivirga cuniculi]